MPTLICQFCKRESSNPGANKKHENGCKLNPDPIKYKRSPLAGTQRGNIPWNKGLTKEIDPRVALSEETKGKLSGENNHQYGKIRSKETKEKISKSRIKYLKENPDKVPYVLNHYSKGPSYAEKYWKKIFEINGLNLQEEHRVYLYSLDFADVDKKIDIEIDGEQHYLDERIVESDKKRTAYLEEHGWKVIRIRWSTYSQKTRKEKELFVNELIKVLQK